MMLPLSIITINLNNKEGLKKTIESVAQQGWNDYEYIVIDGGSSDGSTDVIKDFPERISYWISESDIGIYNAMNKGIKKASGQYCLFLNSGDSLANENILETIFGANDHTQDILYADIIFNKGREMKLVRQPNKLSVIHMIKGTIFHPSAFIRRSLFSTVGEYDESFIIAGDYDFFVKAIIKETASYCHIPFASSVFDTTGISNSVSTKALELKERKMVHQKYFTQEQLHDADVYYRIAESFPYRVINFFERKLKLNGISSKIFNIKYY